MEHWLETGRMEPLLFSLPKPEDCFTSMYTLVSEAGLISRPSWIIVQIIDYVRLKLPESSSRVKLSGIRRLKIWSWGSWGIIHLAAGSQFSILQSRSFCKAINRLHEKQEDDTLPPLWYQSPLVSFLSPVTTTIRKLFNCLNVTKPYAGKVPKHLNHSFPMVILWL